MQIKDASSVSARAEASSLHRPCSCPDFTSSLHSGSLPCRLIVGGSSARCYECGGCKACRLYDEDLTHLNGFTEEAREEARGR